jgi:hypothetical protein
MRICPNCGGVAHVEYVYQTICMLLHVVGAVRCGRLTSINENMRHICVMEQHKVSAFGCKSLYKYIGGLLCH